MATRRVSKLVLRPVVLALWCLAFGRAANTTEKQPEGRSADGGSCDEAGEARLTTTAASTATDATQPKQSRRIKAGSPKQTRRQRRKQEALVRELEETHSDEAGERWAVNPRHANLSFEGYRRQKMFPQINTSFPGLQLIHEKPYMFVVNGFLSPVECALLLQKAKKMTPQHSRGTGNKIGKRKSSGVQLHVEEVPEFRARIANLTGQQLEQLQSLKISRYDPGDSFGPHSDASPHGGVGADPTDFYGDRKRKTLGQKAVPYPGGNRFMTVFVYLNDVENGGRTRWRKLTYDPSFYDDPTPTNVAARPLTEWDDLNAINIQPKAGQAVVFFPATVPELGGMTDHNVVHEAEEAIDTKYVCQQFIYSQPPLYDALKAGHERPKEGSKPDLSIVF